MDDSQEIDSYSEDFAEHGRIKNAEIMLVIVTTLGTIGLVMVAAAKFKDMRFKRKVKKAIKEVQ